MIIGLSGGMGSGKSTAVALLQQHFPIHSVVVVKFAQPLYDIQEFIYDTVKPVYERPASFIKDRKLLQWLGTDWGRNTISESVWVDLWKARVEAIRLSDKANNWTTVIVCDDLRFDNEAEALRSMGEDTTIIKLIRSNNTTHAEGGVGIKGHASEAGIDTKFVDHVVDNNGSLAQYEEKLLQIISKLKGGV